MLIHQPPLFTGSCNRYVCAQAIPPLWTGHASPFFCTCHTSFMHRFLRQVCMYHASFVHMPCLLCGQTTPPLWTGHASLSAHAHLLYAQVPRSCNSTVVYATPPFYTYVAAHAIYSQPYMSPLLAVHLSPLLAVHPSGRIQGTLSE